MTGSEVVAKLLLDAGADVTAIKATISHHEKHGNLEDLMEGLKPPERVESDTPALLNRAEPLGLEALLVCGARDFNKVRPSLHNFITRTAHYESFTTGRYGLE